MLVWFMHGASVRQVGYADPLRSRLIEAFSQQNQPMPEFYSSYWGDALGNAHELWDWVQQDLAAFQWEYPQIALDDVFHYRDRRQQLITGFFNDIFNYLNPHLGREVRRTIAIQFLNFLTSAPFEDELHIVAHSLGVVILWDMLFSDKFAPDDPAHYLRHAIRGLAANSQGRKVTLRSLTTMGAPLLFFNRLLDIAEERVHAFARQASDRPLRWVNIINASDIFAYPIRASLEVADEHLYLRDCYLGDRNFLKKSLGDVTMALGLVSEHSGYWQRRRVARLVTANLLDDRLTLEMPPQILEFGELD